MGCQCSFIDEKSNQTIHSINADTDSHLCLEEGKHITIKGTDYVITKVETKVNGHIRRAIYVR